MRRVRFALTPAWWVAVVLVPVFVLAGCTSSPSPPGSTSLAGVWHADAGDTVLPLDPLFPLAYLDVGGSGTSGTLRLYGANPDSNVLACTDLLYAVPAPGALLLSGRGLYQPVLLGARAEGTTLTLSSETGATLDLEGADAVPASARCAPSSFATTVSAVPLDLAYRSGLLLDGTSLLVAGDDGNVYPVDPATGSLGTAQSLGSGYDHAFAVQAGDYWGHCWCGHNTDVARVQVGGTVIDTVDTEADLGAAMSVSAGTWDGTHLWLAGRQDADGTVHLYRIDSDAEPDVLVDDFAFPVSSVTSLAYADGKLWAVVDAFAPVLVTIDPTTGRATRTVALPPTDESFAGLALTPAATYLITTSESGFSLHTLAY